MRRQAQPKLKKDFDDTARRAALLLRRDFPHLAGILVHGSVARGEPGPFSDIDLDAVTSQRKKPSEFSYFDGDTYVGVAFLSVEEMEKEFSDPKSFFWGRGSAKETRILYDPKRTLRRIMNRWKTAKPSHQLLEKSLWDDYHNMVEYSGKLRNGWLKKDQYLTRFAARIIALHVGRAIIALNEISIISENYYWNQILNARRRPKHIRTDFPLAFGIRGTEDTSMVYRSALRLCRETLRLIQRVFGARAKHKRFKALLATPLDDHGL